MHAKDGQEEAPAASGQESKRGDRTRSLRQSEERFRTLAAAASEAVIIHDRGTILDVNEAFSALFGFQPAEVIGRIGMEVFIAPQSRPAVQARVRSGSEQPYEAIALRKDGAAFPIELRAKMLDYQGRRVRVVTMRDISDRKRYEADREKLLRSIDRQRRLFQMVVDNAPAGIVVLDGKDLRVKWANPAYLLFLEEPFRSKGINGLHLREFVPGADEVGLVEVFRRVTLTNRPHVEPEYEFHGFSRGVTYWRWSLLPLADEGDALPNLMLLVTEITEQVIARKRVEELAAAAQRHAAELQAILDNMVEAVFVADKQGTIILVNDAGVRLLGLPGAEDVLRPIADFPTLLRMRHLDGRTVVTEDLPLSRALAGETMGQVDLLFEDRRTGRDVHLRTSAAPIEDDQGQVVGAVAVSRDVTELTELDRLKDTFISVAAHELKTPVTIVKGYAQALLKAHADIPADHRRMLEAINRGSDRIDNIVSDLLQVSRLHSGPLELAVETTNLGQFVADVVERVVLTLPNHNMKRVRLRAVAPAVVRADRDRIEQVLVNMIDNAIKYSPRGGNVDVAVAVVGPEAVVSVADRGAGIAKDRQEHIFQRFYSAHTGTPHDYGGMGIGLFISREVVLRHGGRMWFESEEGKGSIFYFSLPLSNH